MRCMAVHEEGRRLAICQNNDYIRVYNIGRHQKTPLTLKHPLQTNVTCMAWEPFDERVIAVAVNNKVLIWRLNAKGANIKILGCRPSLQCAQIIELPAQPISHIIWDRTTTNAMLAISPSSNKIMVAILTFHIVDVITGEVNSFGAWTGGNITDIVPSSDGRRLAVLYTGNVIRVYDRNTWREERWGGLAGRAVSARAVVSYIPLLSRRKMKRWVGDSHAIPVFDLSPVEFDPSELEIEGAVEREIITIGGKVQCLTLSPDGQRLAVSFADNPRVVALFVMDWLPFVKLTPTGFVEAPLFGSVSIINFLPKFNCGSMLIIVWTGGCIQYLPLIYGDKSPPHFNSRTILDEINDRFSPGDAKLSLTHRTVSDSLRSCELPKGIIDCSENEEIVLFSEKFRKEKSLET
ncbi:hypothetical protein DICVIV_09087 [Dictyocaulus viviparus]|uniref:WD domain, G-beta repeat protein n=1 Tax=Dictyocaulus viviparus TaxID=29172 RepID=A0A0D8XJX6_DICVI|nr:hypothetical protein DICVIV_09087 [Dictyocaulus viviparus]